MSGIVSVIGCGHKPKTIKKTGMIFGEIHQILVCESCRNDSDLESFVEEKLQ